MVIPVPDRDSTPWWQALNHHKLKFQRCSQCKRWRWPPREVCNECGSTKYQWEEATGRGTVASWTVTRSAAPGVTVPYVVVLVQVEEQDDLFVPGNYEGPSDGGDLVIGKAVTVGFEDIVDEGGKSATLLRWRPYGRE